jgi:hypothetical protein
MTHLRKGYVGGRFYKCINLKKVIVMGIFRKQSDTHEPRYTLDDMRSEIGRAIEKARAARIHPVEIESAVHAIADWQAQRRATTTAVI